MDLRDRVDPGRPFQVLDDLNLDLNEGPTNLDRRHNLVVSGMATIPRTGGLTVSWVARAMSDVAEWELRTGRSNPAQIEERARELGVDGAIRQTHYSRSSDFVPGSDVDVTTWKVGAVWAPIDAIRFRVSRSRDIRRSGSSS